MAEIFQPVKSCCATNKCTEKQKEEKLQDQVNYNLTENNSNISLVN